MKKLIVLGTGAVGTAAVSMAFFGTGVAAADDYAVQTYADASSAASDAGQTIIVASRVGDKLAQDECIVTSSQSAPFLSFMGDDFAHVCRTRPALNLNYNGGLRDGRQSRHSLASPEGREAKVAEDEAAAHESQNQELEAAQLDARRRKKVGG